MWERLQDLNSRQTDAVVSTEGRIRVVAGAGTGKTKALTYRYAYLVNVLGIDPANILCLTFTNKAAAEMRQRISAMVHSGDYNDFVCTIDGFCVKFLRREIYRLGFPRSFTIIDEDDQKGLARQCLESLGIKRSEKTVKNFLKEISDAKALNDYIPTYMLPDVAWDENMLKSHVGNYIHRQMKCYSLDFDDIENFTKFILDRYPDALEWWQGQLNYIMVDEAQDCNADNWEIIEKLAAGHKNLFIVGDPDQCIYEWRGARPQRFVQFSYNKEIVLDENYRSTPKILDVANSVISNNRNRIPKDLFTRQAGGRAVVHFHAKTEEEEYEWMVKQIKLLMSSGATLSDFAILYRSNYLSRGIEKALMNEHLTYTIWGGVRFFERREIKDAVAYLRILSNEADDEAFLRVINVPSRRLGRSFIDTLKTVSEATGQSLMRSLRENITMEALNRPGAADFLKMVDECREFSRFASVSDTLKRVLDDSGYMRSVREDQDEETLENIDELMHSVKFYEESHNEFDVTLSDYLQDIALYTNQDYRKDNLSIKLMTIHQAKGLEFPYVFITGLSEGIFPNMRTIREYKKNGEEEERRLMYVAITRAEKVLFLTESEGFNVSTRMNKYPSRFLTEIKRNMFVTEGFVPEELWKGTRNLVHVLDEETFGRSPEAPDGFAAERAGWDSPFQIGTVVTHDIFGEGIIVAANKEWTTFEVKFSDGSTRHLRASFLRLGDLP